MKKFFFKTLFILISICKLFSDDSYGTINPTIGAFEIKNTSDIEMTDEIVEIWEDHVKVTFHFTNLTKKKQTVEIGFPVRWMKSFHRFGNEEDTEDTTEFKNKIEQYYQFKSKCNGKNLPRKLICNLNTEPVDFDSFTYNYWFVSELTFEPNEVLEVIDEYNAGYFDGGDSIGGLQKQWEYILTTGSTWANVIKKATIIFHTKDTYNWNNYSIDKYTDMNYCFDIENIVSYRCYVPQSPNSIIHDEKNKEYILTWNLKNIKPEKNWIMGIETFNPERRPYESPFNHDNFNEIAVLFLLQEDLFKIPSFKKKCLKYNKCVNQLWGGNNSEDYEKDSIEYDYSSTIRQLDKEQFISSIKKMINTCFPEGKSNTEVAKIYAQFFINAIYAYHGYSFKNEKWTTIFSKFTWYKPSTSEISNIKFSKEEQKLIEKLLEYR